MTTPNDRAETISDDELDGAQGAGPFLGPLIGSAVGQKTSLKDLEAEDRLGNFEIQELMATMNQAETLSSNIQKKMDDTESAIIGNLRG